jgi:hypothetical protein
MTGSISYRRKCAIPESASSSKFTPTRSLHDEVVLRAKNARSVSAWLHAHALRRPTAHALARGRQKPLHHNVLTIGLADKLARITWAVWAPDRAFEASRLQAARSFASRRVLTCRGPRENKTRWRFGLPGACEHW